MQKLARSRGWQISEVRGEAVSYGNRQITPIGRVLRFNGPRGAFAWTWQRPAAVEVREGDVVRRLPIYDGTLRAIVTIVLTGLALTVVVSSQLVRSRRRRIF